MKLLTVIINFITLFNAIVIAHRSDSYKDLTKKIPDVKEGLWSQYGKLDFMHDLDHLKEEANKLLYMQESDQITTNQSALYYTRLHDFNNDGGLDGLELLLAVKHSLVHINGSFESKDLESFADYVDSELNLMDLNNDGFVNYGEIYTYLESSKQNNKDDDNKDHNIKGNDNKDGNNKVDPKQDPKKKPK